MNIQVDLKANPEVADLISDMEMGKSVSFVTSLKSKNDSLAEFTLTRAEEGPEDEDEEDGDDESEEEAEVDGDQMKRHSKMPAPGGSQNTPGGSAEQDKLAAALSAQI